MGIVFAYYVYIPSTCLVPREGANPLWLELQSIFFKKKKIYYVSECFACMWLCMYTTGMPGAHWDQKVMWDPWGHWCWESNQSRLLSAEPTLKSLASVDEMVSRCDRLHFCFSNNIVYLSDSLLTIYIFFFLKSVLPPTLVCDKASGNPGWTRTCIISKDGPELLVLLPPPSKCWDYRCIPG